MFKHCGHMFLFRDRNDAQSVIDIFHMLREMAAEELFRALFLLVLTDNGSEFSNPSTIQCDKSGVRTAQDFCCDLCAFWQKGHVERNHEFNCYILPKGITAARAPA